MVDARGVPPSLVASGANVHDVKLLGPTLDRIVLARPEPDPKRPQNLCADAGYKGDPAFQAAVARNYQPHIKQRKEEADAKRNRPGWKAPGLPNPKASQTSTPQFKSWTPRNRSTPASTLPFQQIDIK